MPKVTRMWSPDESTRNSDSRFESASWQVVGVAASVQAQVAEDSVTGLTPARINDPFIDQDGNVYASIRCDGVRVTTQGFQLFTVTATYSNGVHGEQPDDPLEKPIEYAWEMTTTREIVEVDANGNAIVNAAGDPPEQPCVQEVELIYLNCLRNESTFDASQAIANNNKVNSDAFFGAEPGQAKVKGVWSANTTTEGEIFYPVRYRFEFRRGINGEPNGFKKRLVNRGYNMIVDGKIKRIVEGDAPGALVDDAVRDAKPSISRPRLLAADGSLLAADAAPVVLEFDIYESIDFARFNLE